MFVVLEELQKVVDLWIITLGDCLCQRREILVMIFQVNMLVLTNAKLCLLSFRFSNVVVESKSRSEAARHDLGYSRP